MKKFNNQLLLGLFALISCSLYASPTDINIDEECMEGEDVFSLYCPYDVTIDCNSNIYDLSAYGTATYHDYSGWHNAGNPVVHYNLSTCNTGTIVRTWTVEDYNWVQHSCSQTITVSGNGYNTFGYDDINWPQEHVTLEGCYANTHPSNLPYNQGYPTWNYVNCSMVGVSYTDQIFHISNTCKKIVRKWKVLDWCQYDPNNYGGGYGSGGYGSGGYGSGWGSNGGYGNNGTPGLWTFYQTIKISKSDVPVIECPDDINVSAYNCKEAHVNVDPLWVSGNTCNGEYTITNNSPYAYSNGADISGIYPVGYTTVKYTVEYGCGLKRTCTVKIHVDKNKPPTPYCLAHITTALMPVDNDGDGIPEDGMAEIWASDLNIGSTANCYNGSLTFSFSSDVTETARTFTCEDVGDNEVQMWVTDSRGNQAYCVATITVQNNSANIPDCEPNEDDDEEEEDDDEEEGDDEDDDNDDDGYPDTGTYSVFGKVKNLAGDWLPGVDIELKKLRLDTSFISTTDTLVELVVDTIYTADSMQMFNAYFDTTLVVTTDTFIGNATYDVTTAPGGYGFYKLAVPACDYEVSGTYTAEADLSTINTDDLDFLMDYLMGAVTFTEPHQKIAADVDQNGEIDFNDLKAMLDLLTGVIDELPGNPKWEVVDATQLSLSADELFDQGTNVISFTVDSSDVNDVNFVVIQLGDIVLDYTYGLTTPDVDLAELSRIVNSPVSVKEKVASLRTLSNVNSEVNAHPNPFNNTLFINYTDEVAGNVTVDILDLTGKVLYQNQFNSVTGNNSFKLDEVNCPSGVIIYRLTDGNMVKTGKVIKI